MPDNDTGEPEQGPSRSAAEPAPWQSCITTLLEQEPPFLPDRAQAMTLLVQYPPGHTGIPPHRHTGPAFGYVIEGEMLFELEGERERVVRAGESFREPGGDVIHV